MTRVAYILEQYPELSQTFVETELREVRRQGDDPTVLALRPGPHGDLADPAFDPHHPPRGARRITAFARTATTHPRALRNGPWPPDGRRARGIARIAPWLTHASEADHLHAHFASEATDIAALLSELSGTPFSFTGHSTDLFADPAGLRRRLNSAAFAVVVCEYDREEVDRLAPGHRGRVEVVPVGLDLEALRRTTPYDPDGPVVAVGRLVEQKGFADLVAVAQEIGREVVIAGDGPLRDKLDRPHVRLTGALTPAESLELIERASVLVAPSVVAADGSRDGIPTVIKEALALETPVIASDAVGNPEVIRPAHGLLYAARDRSALKQAIAALLGNSDREAMGRAGRAFAEDHADITKSAARLRALWGAAQRAR
jgi:glycosyltransferase involved in cell wall biosynthesis